MKEYFMLAEHADILSPKAMVIWDRNGGPFILAESREEAYRRDDERRYHAEQLADTVSDWELAQWMGLKSEQELYALYAEEDARADAAEADTPAPIPSM